MKTKILTNQRGQGLTEYLIIVALVAVASIGLVRVVGGNVGVQFGNIANALTGKGTSKQIQGTTVSKKDTDAKNLSNFMTGANGEGSIGENSDK